jgi:hypothetical protein
MALNFRIHYTDSISVADHPADFAERPVINALQMESVFDDLNEESENDSWIPLYM